jgi:hypothetical protein
LSDDVLSLLAVRVTPSAEELFRWAAAGADPEGALLLWGALTDLCLSVFDPIAIEELLSCLTGASILFAAWLFSGLKFFEASLLTVLASVLIFAAVFEFLIEFILLVLFS